MAGGLRQFATYQPFTAFTDTVRDLLTSGPIGDHAAVSAAWCAGIAVTGYIWAMARYNRGPAAAPGQ